MPKYFSRRLGCLTKKAWDSFRSFVLDCSVPTNQATGPARCLFLKEECATQPPEDKDGADADVDQDKKLTGGE